MIHEKDIFDDLGPGGEPERLEPESGKQHSSFMITGRVFDHSTSGLGKGLYVYAYQHDSDKKLIYRKKNCL
ncbi:hypothetical protein [Marinifilum fragile]|uniref:hypothetical protein n=1 Tax=Marinifilum fragile TaxID=570161 RepID=UPI0006D0562A|nr:hypothetical protein [Marinifilum fragile]